MRHAISLIIAGLLTGCHLPTIPPSPPEPPPIPLPGRPPMPVADEAVPAPPLSPIITNFAIYQGTSPGQYVRRTNVGPVTWTKIPLIPGATNYFAATAIDDSGLESTSSSEVETTNITATSVTLAWDYPGFSPLYRLRVWPQSAPTVSGPWSDYPPIIEQLNTNPPSVQVWRLQIRLERL